MKKRKARHLQVIIEYQDGHFWGRIEGHGFMPTGQGETMEALLQNIKDCIEDYIEHEGKLDKFWSREDLSFVSIYA